MTTLREQLKQRLEKDYAKIKSGKLPKTVWNIKDQQMNWNEERKLYVGKNSKGVEIIAPIRNTIVEFFWFKCTNLARKGDIEIECGKIHAVSIINDKPVKCNKCHKTFTIKFNIDSTSKAFKTFKNLDKEV